MGTRARILKKTGESSYLGIHLNYDGYPEHAGKILLEHWNTQEKVDFLIGLGDISSLGPTREDTEPYTDLGESFEDVRPLPFSNTSMSGHVYIFIENQWHYRYGYTTRLLVDEFEKE